MIKKYINCAYTYSLKQPEYQHYRESIGSAKALGQLEEITAEIKTSLLVFSTLYTCTCGKNTAYSVQSRVGGKEGSYALEGKKEAN